MRYLVGYTHTQEGRDALHLGIRLAIAHHAELDVVVVLAGRPTAGLAPTEPGYLLYGAAQSWLAEASAAIPPAVPHRTHAVFGDSTEGTILELAESWGSAAVVVGTATGGVLQRVTIGSVANALLHSAPVPVALAPASSSNTPITRISRITAAIGTRDGADALLETSIALTRQAELPLRLLTLAALDLPGGTANPQAEAQATAHADDVLTYAASKLPADVPVTTLHAQGTRIEDAVTAVHWDPSEIVLVGSSRLARPHQLFFGSVAAKMIRALPVPVIVVPRDAVLSIGA